MKIVGSRSCTQLLNLAKSLLTQVQCGKVQHVVVLHMYSRQVPTMKVCTRVVQLLSSLADVLLPPSLLPFKLRILKISVMLYIYSISLNNVRGHSVNQQFQKCKNLNNFLFYLLTFLKKGDIIQRGTLFKGGH